MGVHSGICKSQITQLTVALFHSTPAGSCFSLGVPLLQTAVTATAAGPLPSPARQHTSRRARGKCAAVPSTLLGVLRERKTAQGPHKALAWPICAKAAEGGCWGFQSSLPRVHRLLQLLFLVRPGDSQICPDVGVQGDSMWIHVLIFILLSLGVGKKPVSYWTQCPHGWLLKSLPVFSNCIIWLSKRYCFSLQILFLLPNMAALIMAVVYNLTN